MNFQIIYHWSFDPVAFVHRPSGAKMLLLWSRAKAAFTRAALDDKLLAGIIIPLGALACVVISLAIIALTTGDLKNGFWATEVSDTVVMTVIFSVALGLLVLLIASIIWPTRNFDRVKDSIRYFGAVVLGVTTLYIGYATLRNQVRLTTETNLRAEGLMLFGMEMDKDNSHLRCIYENYGHNDFNGCLNYIVSDKDRWASTIFYVEESFWLIEQAARDAIITGSEYSRVIDYWREYLAEDPTGIFAYFAVVSCGGIVHAQHFMTGIGVDVDVHDIGQRYVQVTQALARRGAKAPLAKFRSAYNKCAPISAGAH